MSLLTRFIIIVAVVVSIVDVAVFLAIEKYPEISGQPVILAIAAIVATVLPISINLWWWLRKGGGTQSSLRTCLS